MANEKQIQLLNRLFDATNEDKLAWQETPGPNTFSVSFSNLSLTIREVDSQNDLPDYWINVLDYSGRSIESFSDVSLSSDLNDEQKRSLKIFHKMSQIYQKARRSALGSDKALDELLRELKALDDIPF